MADPLSTDEGTESSGAKENFIAEVEFSRQNCDCEHCEKGRQNANFEQEDDVVSYDHLLSLKPLTQYEKQQHEFNYTVRSGWETKWMLFIGHLQQIHGNLKEAGVDSLDNLGDFLTGRVYEFREITWEEDEEFTYPDTDQTVNFSTMFDGLENPPNEMLVPVREITDEDELMDLGVQQDSPEDVDQVEL